MYEGAWRFRTHDLLQPMPTKSHVFKQVQFCSAKRHGQAMAFTIIAIGYHELHKNISLPIIPMLFFES